MHFPADITAHLVFWDNLEGQVANSDLDLAGNMLHHACMVNSFDILKRTTPSHTNNMVGLWCQRKGSATSTSPPAHLLRLQAIHQRFHRYVPRHEFLSGVYNSISDHPSSSQYITDTPQQCRAPHRGSYRRNELARRGPQPPWQLLWM